MKELHFYKMQGTGNDFVVVDNRNNTLSLDEIIEHTRNFVIVFLESEPTVL